MKTVEIHLTPEQFPATTDAVFGLIATVQEEAFAYCQKHELPESAYVSILNSLLFTVKNVLSHQQKLLKEEFPDAFELEKHFEVLPDGSSRPMEVSP